MELFDKEWSLIGAIQGAFIGLILVLASFFASLKQPKLRVVGCLGIFLVVGTGVVWYYAGFWAVVITFIILGILIGGAASGAASGGMVRSRYGRVTHCYSCKSGLDGSTHSTCWNCKWIRCPNCGACGCGFRKRW